MDIEWYGRQMSLFANNDGSIADYSYNADGIRTSKTLYGTDVNLIGTTEYVLDGNKIVAEKTGSQWTYYMYDENGAPAGIIYDGELYGYRKNLQGDIVEIVHSEYNVSLVQYTYSPYGEVLSISGTMADTLGVANPFRYRSYYYDTETGFYYLQSRYYDPVVGRFLNADAYVSTSQGILGNNMFAYCGNNPVNREDAYGYMWGAVPILPALAKYKAVYAGFAAATVVDGPLPVVDVVVAAAAIVFSTIVIGIDIYESYSKQDSVSESKVDEKVEEKEEVIYGPPKPEAPTYYHSTTLYNALSIKTSGIMYGSKWEGGFVYAWKFPPTKRAVKNSGARRGAIISFKTAASFSLDTGIEDKSALMYGPLVSDRPGPIYVWDVKIVG